MTALHDDARLLRAAGAAAARSAALDAFARRCDAILVMRRATIATPPSL
jgi:hypothetical protein